MNTEKILNFNKTFVKFFLYIAIVNIYTLYCQENSGQIRQVNIDNIRINGVAVQKQDLNDLVISRNDLINFRFSLSVKNVNKTDFLFRIVLKNGIDSSSKTQGDTIAVYKNIPEGDYKFTVYAFDPGSNWTAAPATIKFRVNNRESSLKKEIERLKNKALKCDTINVNKKVNSGFYGNFDIISLILGLILGLIILGIIFYITINKLKKNYKENNLQIGKKMNAISQGSISKENHEKVLMENKNLKAEIEALRGQIDTLNSRTNELHHQNRDLQEKVDKLSKSQLEIEELQKQKDDLFAVIIHDIKNPASLIKSLVDLLRSYDLTATEQHEIIDDIFETTTKIVALSQEVSRILALEGTKLQLQFEPAQINDIIVDVNRRNSIAAKNKNIEILLDLSDTLPDTMIDVQKADEIIENLLSNAIKFSQENAKVLLRSQKVDNTIVVEISDNGPGLSEEDVKQAFQRGSRLSAKPTAGEPSSGFGLWIVKKLIEAHNGRVWIKSVVGRGSTFAFSLPITNVDPSLKNGE